MRFSSHSDEESCGLAIRWREYDVACMRTKGHDGDCIAQANKAGEADGVRWCCRVQIDQPHADWCMIKYRLTTSST